MNDQELHAYCEQWRQWCLTRKYFIEPGAQNILARMQPSKSGPEVDGNLSAGMSFFNMAVHALADMNYQEALPFIIFYCRRSKNIKVEAAKMSIHRDTFYDRKKRFARKAYSMAQSFRQMHERDLQQEKEEILVD